MSINVSFEPIYDEKEAQIAMFTLNAGFFNAGYFGSDKYSRAERDACNGALEAFFVTTLRAEPKESLGTRLAALKSTFGELNAFKRAVARVKAFRSKNPAWRTFEAA